MILNVNNKQRFIVPPESGLLKLRTIKSSRIQNPNVAAAQ